MAAIEDLRMMMVTKLVRDAQDKGLALGANKEAHIAELSTVSASIFDCISKKVRNFDSNSSESWEDLAAGVLSSE